MNVYATDCRGCGRRVTRHTPPTPKWDNTKAIRVRCRDCGATNHASDDGEAYRRGEVA